MTDPSPLVAPPPADLAPAIGPLPGDVRGTLGLLHRMAFRSVQLDGRRPELDPAGISGSGRRDLLATLRRRELRLAGLDFLLPVRELLDPASSDAAVSRAIDAVRLAADLGRVPVSMRFPREDAGASASAAVPAPAGTSAIAPGTGTGTTAAGLVLPAEHERSLARAADPGITPATAAIAAAADLHGVLLVDHAIPLRASMGPLVPGLDVAAALAAGADPMLTMATADPRLGSIRLSDLSDDGRRVPVGHPDGRLALGDLAATLAMGDRRVPLVLDPRQCTDPWAALASGARAWTEVAP